MSKKEKEKKDKEKEKTPEVQERLIPPLDFSSLVLPFYSQALMKLGLMKDPQNNKEEEDLELTKRLIDLLDLLKDKTKGNLNPEEKNFLDTCLQQIKMIYMEKAELIK
jgi:hypothetical protein